MSKALNVCSKITIQHGGERRSHPSLKTLRADEKLCGVRRTAWLHPPNSFPPASVNQGVWLPPMNTSTGVACNPLAHPEDVSYARKAQQCQNQSTVNAFSQTTRSPARSQSDRASARVEACACLPSIRRNSHSNAAHGNGGLRRAKSSTTSCPPGKSSRLSPESVATGSTRSCSAFVQVIRSKVSGA